MAQRVFEVRVPAEPCSLHVVRAFVTRVLRDVPGADADNLVLAVDETCANIVRHRARVRGRDEIDVRVELEPDLVRFRFACFCCQQDVPRIRPRDLAGRRAGGLGRRLIGEIMDRIDYEPDPAVPGLMTLVLEKHLGTGAHP
jgi:anti-sigma regulatory factor (Ser/Thr protein kinase)